jgi:hypothetical protein
VVCIWQATRYAVPPPPGTAGQPSPPSDAQREGHVPHIQGYFTVLHTKHLPCRGRCGAPAKTRERVAAPQAGRTSPTNELGKQTTCATPWSALRPYGRPASAGPAEKVPTLHAPCMLGRMVTTCRSGRRDFWGRPWLDASHHSSLRISATARFRRLTAWVWVVPARSAPRGLWCVCECVWGGGWGRSQCWDVNVKTGHSWPRCPHHARRARRPCRPHNAVPAALCEPVRPLQRGARTKLGLDVGVAPAPQLLLHLDVGVAAAERRQHAR